MNYEIKSFDRITGSALVRFWTDDYPDGLHYNVDIPLKDGAYISGAELDAHIQCFAPVGQINRMVALAAIDASGLEAMVVPDPVPEKTPEQIKADQIAAINKIKQEKLTGGFVHNGIAFPCDGVFQQQVTAFIVAWESGVLPLDATVAVRTYDDLIVNLGVTEVKALAAALLVYVQSVYAESWAAKDALV